MSIRNKQTWIKDILSKSGTEITAVNEDKSEGWFFPMFYVFISIFFSSFSTQRIFVMIIRRNCRSTSLLLISKMLTTSKLCKFINEKKNGVIQLFYFGRRNSIGFESVNKIFHSLSKFYIVRLFCAR